MTQPLLISESLRRFTEQRPSPSRPPLSSPLQRLSPRLHSEEEPGAPGWSFPITLPQDGGLQMALLASTTPRNRPCGFNDAFVRTGVIVCHLFVDILGGSTWEIPSSRFGLWQPWAPGKERRRPRRTPATYRRSSKPVSPGKEWERSDWAPRRALLWSSSVRDIFSCPCWKVWGCTVKNMGGFSHWISQLST